MKIRKWAIFIMLLLIVLSGCGKNKSQKINEETSDFMSDEAERQDAEEKCREMMKSIQDIYHKADKGNTLNVFVSDEIMYQMQQVIKNTKYPVTTMAIYSNMENYKIADDFLDDCINGKSGSVVICEIHSDGGIGWNKYSFDGENMNVLSTCAVWNDNEEPEITYTSYNGIEEWKYTDKGWFCYKLCESEPMQFVEPVNENCMIRVKPLNNYYCSISKEVVFPIGYQGNNILCSDWNMDNMEDLDYNAVYEYLYNMKYQKETYNQEYPDGIPQNEFENLIMEYLPVTREQIRKYAVFNEENQTYAWERLGCLNYSPTLFGTSVPEVTDIKDNGDGTVTLTVDAVCEMCFSDAVISGKLIVSFSEDGSFKYLGNEILDDGIKNIPEYQYRIR